MKNDQLYKRLRERMGSVSVVPPQEVGPFTLFWKIAASFFKTNPLKVFLASGFVSSLILWFLLGATLVRLVSILQYGF